MGPGFALTYAANHDRPTKLVAPIAKQAHVLLEELGFEVEDFPRDDAGLARLYTRVKNGDGGVAYGYFCAHGSDAGIHGLNGSLVLAIDNCSVLVDAVVMLCSCLEGGGAFAARITSIQDAPSAVIGFRDYLKLPPQSTLYRLLPFIREKPPKWLVGVLLLPLELIAKEGWPVHRAVKETKEEWLRLARDPSFDWRLRELLWENAANLDHWPR